MALPRTSFQNWITSDGSSGFLAEADRYHLYISCTCPYASRVSMVRSLKGLQSIIGMTALDPHLDRTIGWAFTDKFPNCQLDPINGKGTLKEIYDMADPQYAGKVTVPVLWDKQTRTVVSTESAHIIKMLNSEFNQFGATEQQRKMDLYPENLREKIDQINQRVGQDVNDGVYAVAFASSQHTYIESVQTLFNCLDHLESLLEHSRFLLGPNLTLADVRLFPSLIRFDWAYHGLFKCNKKKLIEYPNLWAYTRDIYNMDGVASTVHRDHILIGYYTSTSMQNLNPTKIVPIGPDLDLSIPVERRKKFGVE